MGQRNPNLRSRNIRTVGDPLVLALYHREDILFDKLAVYDIYDYVDIPRDKATVELVSKTFYIGDYFKGKSQVTLYGPKELFEDIYVYKIPMKVYNIIKQLISNTRAINKLINEQPRYIT